MVNPERPDGHARRRRAQLARHDVLRQLVGGDRCEPDRGERQPLLGPAASERSANDTGARPSVDEPRERRRVVRLAHPRSALRASSMQSDAQGRLEPLRRRSPCRIGAGAKRAVLDALSAASISPAAARSSPRACSRRISRPRWLSLRISSSSSTRMSRGVALHASRSQQLARNGRCRCSPSVLSARGRRRGVRRRSAAPARLR